MLWILSLGATLYYGLRSLGIQIQILVCKKLILDRSASKIHFLLKALAFGLHPNSILTKKLIGTGSRGLLKRMAPFRALVGVAALLPLLLQCSVAVTEVSCSDIVPMKWRREVISITDFGAVGDGRTLNTWPFKKAIYRIQHLRSRGGTLLYIPPGVWLTGSFSLTSHMTLYLARGAVIKATQVLLLVAFSLLSQASLDFWHYSSYRRASSSRKSIFGLTALQMQDTWNWPLVDPLPSYGRGRELPGRRYVSFIQGDGISDVIITGELQSICSCYVRCTALF